MSTSKTSIPPKKTISKSSPRSSGKPAQEARRPRKKSCKFKEMMLPVPSGMADIWDAFHLQNDAFKAEAYHMLAETAQLMERKSQSKYPELMRQAKCISISSDEEDEDYEPFNFFDETVDTLVADRTNEFVKEFSSELHAVPFQERCQLLGGGREKKRVKKKNRPMRPRKPRQSGPYIAPTNKKNDRTRAEEFKYLTYNDPDTLINAASPFQIITYQFTSAYDVSSGILTTAYSGFEEWCQFYDYNRVRLTEVDWSVANNEATVGVRVGMIPTCFDANANILTYQGAIDLMEGPYSTGLVMLGRANGGGDTHHFKYTAIPEQILGNREYLTSNLWRGTFNSSPTNMLYFNLVVISVGSGTNLTNGVTGNLALRSKVDFWFRRDVPDPRPSTPLSKPVLKVKQKKDESSDSEELVVVSTRKRDRLKP